MPWSNTNPYLMAMYGSDPNGNPQGMPSGISTVAPPASPDPFAPYYDKTLYVYGSDPNGMVQGAPKGALANLPTNLFQYDPTYSIGASGTRPYTPYELSRLQSDFLGSGLSTAVLGKLGTETNRPLLAPPTTMQWDIDSPEQRAGVMAAANSREGGVDPATEYYGTMGISLGGNDERGVGGYNPNDPSSIPYNPSSRSGYAYGPNNTLWRAQFDAQGHAIPGSVTSSSLDDDAFGYAALIAAAIATGGVAAAGGGLGAAGTTAGTAAGAGGGLSSADLAALYGNAGYGAGMTGAETAAFDVGLGGLGVGGLETLPAADYSLEGAHYGVGGLNPATASPINAIPGVPSGLPELPGADYSHEGGNYGPGGLDAATNAPVNVGAGAPTSALSNLSSSFKDWAAKNPMQAIQLAGTLGGKLFGGGQTISGGGIGSTGGAQADLTKNMPTAYSRQYVAPPAGYRPGISGEHVYFKNTGG